MKSAFDCKETLPFPSVVECSVRALGVVHCQPNEIAERRKSIAAEGRHDTARNVVRTCDDQSVLAVAAMREALRAFHPADLSQWGMIGAPRYLGRSRIAAAIARFREAGVRGMPPSLIPFQASHAVAGTLSLYFRIHGPAIGVSNTEEHVAECLLAAITWCQSDDLPGVWLVMTGWNPEPMPDDSGDAWSSTNGYGVAMALEKTSDEALARLQYRARADHLEAIQPISIRSFAERIVDRSKNTWSVPTNGGGVVSFQRAASILRLAS